MAEFTIVLEDLVEVTTGKRTEWIAGNQRGDVIDAEDIDTAWEAARLKYYIGKDEPVTQVVDVLPGNVDIQPSENLSIKSAAEVAEMEALRKAEMADESPTLPGAAQ